MPAPARTLRLRLLTEADIDELHRLEAEAYLPELHESDDAFLQMMRLFPQGAFGFFDAQGLCGYAFGAPSKAGTLLTLRQPLEKLPADADTFYIHDVAVTARCRGRGIGRMLAAELLAVARARGFSRSELVSVQGSAAFWRQFGFEAVYEFEYVPGVPSVKMAARWHNRAMALAHFTLATRDVEKTARFLERTLGYRRNAVPADSPVAVVWFDIGNGQEMHLLQVDGFEMSAFESEFGRHVALRHPAGDYEPLKRRLIEAGATLIDPIRPTPFARFFFRDPVNGYVFEIVEAPAASHFDQ